jgi:hypothetical protein
MLQALTVAECFVKEAPVWPGGGREHRKANANGTPIAETVIRDSAAGALLARCLRYERKAPQFREVAHPGEAARSDGGTFSSDTSQRSLPSYTGGRRAAAEPRESAAFGPHALERPHANAIWANPPLETADYSATPHSGAQTRSGTVAAVGNVPLTEPVTALRGFEPGRIVAPRLIKGGAAQYPAARIQAESESGDENLRVLAEQIKKILDEEARRHGIPV